MHSAHIAAEIRQTAPVADAAGRLWNTYEATGRARLVCPCGTTTGFIPTAAALDAANDHPRGA